MNLPQAHEIKTTRNAVHDIHHLKNINNNFSSYILVGNKACLSAGCQLNSFTSNNIILEVQIRINQHDYAK